MSIQPRTLVLLRHAKSEYPAGVADRDRPLAPRGVREAGLAGDWLRANLPDIDLVLCSAATRTRQTLTRTGLRSPVRYIERLYDATPGTVIDEINGAADEVATVLVIRNLSRWMSPSGVKRLSCRSPGWCPGLVG